MDKIDKKVLQDVFDAIVNHFEILVNECHCDISFTDFSRYLVGVRYALCIAFGLDNDSRTLMAEFFEQKTNEYFGGKESE